jgi:hypothetical protein
VLVIEMVAEEPTGPDVGIKLIPQAPPAHPSAVAGRGRNSIAIMITTIGIMINRFMLTFIVLFWVKCQVSGV